MTWQRRQDNVQSLVHDGSLEYVSGADADAAALLASAGSLLDLHRVNWLQTRKPPTCSPTTLRAEA